MNLIACLELILEDDEIKNIPKQGQKYLFEDA